MRLGVTEPDGTPLVHPVWYTWEQDQFLLHIPTKSRKCMAIEVQPTVYFTVGPSIFGVRGKARAAVDPPIESGCATYCKTNGTGIPGDVTPKRAALA